MSSPKTLLVTLAAIAALGLPAAALAHGSMKPQHGGLVQVTGETLFELVNSPSGVIVYVRDDDDGAIDVGAMSAQLTIMPKAGAASSVALAPAGSDRFEAKGVTIPAGSKVGVMLIDKTTQAHSSVTFAVD